MSFLKIHFKDFILNESKYYLAERIGIIFSAIQDLLENFEGIGKRQLIFNCENLISQMRSILQDKWSEKEKKYLLEIQKIAVALSKCLNEKGEIRETLESVVDVLEKISEKLGVPINTIGQDSEENETNKSDKQPNDQQMQQPNEQQPNEQQPNDQQPNDQQIQ